jgi:two-component system, OmpR family, sensor kinase
MTNREQEKFAGLALRCDADGFVQEIISDSLGAENCVSRGEPFVNLVDDASRAKAEAFLTTLRERKAAFGWEMNVACETGGITPVHFAGTVSAESGEAETFFIVGAKSRIGVSRFYNDLIRINNEQTNAVRAAVKDLSLQMRELAERDNFHYDELSRLNNELATAQRELAKKNFELARLNEQKNQFLGIAAHDLRNPLEVIQTYSEFLLEDASGILPAEQIEFIHKIYSSSAYMLNLVNDFLDYSKIEAGRLALNLSESDLVRIVARVVEQMRVLADKKQIRIALNAPGDLPKISADESKIEQVLHNLLGNALKFSPPGTTIEVGARRGENNVILSVKDSGQGIAPDEAETLFNPFVKGKSKATGGEKSAGLGLAIVKKIVEGHGGEITLETEVGKGTVFYVALPLRAKNDGDKKDSATAVNKIF